MHTRNLFSAIIATTIFSLICALSFLVLDGVDVSLTEAAVGAGISTILFLSSIKNMDAIIKNTTKPSLAFIIIFALLLAMISYVIMDLPEFGLADASLNSFVTNYYLENSYREIGIPNTVTSILASYRGFDTLGEIVVIFIAGISVIGILRHDKEKIK